MCPFCKDEYLKNECEGKGKRNGKKKGKWKKNIVSYDEHTFKCHIHEIEYNSYCQNCKADLCPKCRHECKNMKLVQYSTFMKEEEDIYQKSDFSFFLLSSFRNTKKPPVFSDKRH